LLVGHEGHEEVVGTAGEAPSRVRLVDGSAGAAEVEVRDPSKVVWLSQTTLSVDETIETVNALRERFPALIDPPSDDICYATQNRQAAVKVIAAQAELVIVVGSPNSSNSVRLVEVAKDYGAQASYLVDDAGELEEGWLSGVTTVGVTSGASVPEELVTSVLAKLAGFGFGTVEEVEAVEEHMTFALPRELRTPRPAQTGPAYTAAGSLQAGRATRHNPILGITAVSPAGFSRASRRTRALMVRRVDGRPVLPRGPGGPATANDVAVPAQHCVRADK
jgi:hypothetical protein